MRIGSWTGRRQMRDDAILNPGSSILVPRSTILNPRSSATGFFPGIRVSVSAISCDITVVTFAFDVEIVEHHAEDLRSDTVELLPGASQNVSRAAARLNDEDHPVNHSRKNYGVGNIDQRRGINQDVIEFPGQDAESVFHPLRADQLRRVRRDRPAREHIQIRYPKFMNQGINLDLSREKGRESLGLIHLENLVDRRAAQVGVNQ